MNQTIVIFQAPKMARSGQHDIGFLQKLLSICILITYQAKIYKLYCQNMSVHDSLKCNENIYTVWQKRRYSKTQSCFIQAVISSSYVEINQQIIFAVSCFEGISNFVQRYHQTDENQGRNLTSRMPSLSKNFQKTWKHWKIEKERDNHG